MSIEILVAIILVLLFSVLGLFLWRRGSPKRVRTFNDAGSEIIASKKICPLCSGTLAQGLRIYSTLFPGKKFDLMHIFGCRYCWSGKGASISIPDSRTAGSSSVHYKTSRRLKNRHCPCCKHKLPVGGYVMARVYRKSYRPPHVHVYGCTICRPGMRML